MTTAKLREEIRDYIKEADDHFVQMVYAMMSVSKKEEPLTISEKSEIALRVARHKKKESKSYSWKEVRARIEKRLK